MKLSKILCIACMCKCNVIGCIIQWLASSFKGLKEREQCVGNILDITHACSATVYKKTENGVTYTTFTPNNEDNIVEVTEEGGRIWKGSSSEQCLHLRTYSGNEGQLLTLCTHSQEGLGFLRFEKRDGKWVSIGKFTFMMKLMQMKEEYANKSDLDPPNGRNAHPSYCELFKNRSNSGLKLDISNINPAKMNIFDLDFRGIRGLSCSPKNGYFRKIMEGKELIWKAQEREFCTLAYIYSKDNSPKLLAIYTRMDDNVVCRHYERAYLGWNEITEDAFCMTFGFMEDVYRLIHS